MQHFSELPLWIPDHPRRKLSGHVRSVHYGRAYSNTIIYYLALNATSHTVPPVYVYDRAGMPYTLLVNGTGCDAPTTAEKSLRKSRKSRSTQVNRLECLRDLEYNVLLNASMTLLQTLPFSRQVTTWGPSYKAGSLIDRRPSERLIDGDFIKIPMILGTNKDEGKLSLPRLLRC
jgi:hypothetical protein